MNPFGYPRFPITQAGIALCDADADIDNESAAGGSQTPPADAGLIDPTGYAARKKEILDRL